ncbi:MAG: rane protein [Deltaproteobacteria bacterium]|jgi:outer membrane protein|nr:rane protein [Deltaproteobacteria bacterium]
MKKIAVVAGLMFLGVSMASMAWSADAIKIGYVDMQKALNQCEAGKDAKKTITEEVEKMQKSFMGKQRELERLKEDLEKRASVLSENVRREKEKEYQAKLRDMQRLQRDYEEDVRRKDREHTERILRELEIIVKKLGDEGKYTLILERNQPALVYITGSLEITDEVIKIADRNYKKK